MLGSRMTRWVEGGLLRHRKTHAERLSMLAEILEVIKHIDSYPPTVKMP